jgi:hypothetical protein
MKDNRQKTIKFYRGNGRWNYFGLFDENRHGFPEYKDSLIERELDDDKSSTSSLISEATKDCFAEINLVIHHLSKKRFF